MRKFNRDDLEFFLPEYFKGLHRKYMLACIFSKEIQELWVPGKGDIIVGDTGNIFTINEMQDLSRKLGGTLYFYGGGLCSREDSPILDNTYCYTVNKSGNYYHPTKGKQENFFHSSIEEFRFVPYPHELENMNVELYINEM